MKCCEKCIHYGLYLMITGKQPYGYSTDIPCLRCENYFTTKNEFVPKLESEWCECEKPQIIRAKPYHIKEVDYCDGCGKPIKPKREPKFVCQRCGIKVFYDSEHKICGECEKAIKPKRELPEKMEVENEDVVIYSIC